MQINAPFNAISAARARDLLGITPLLEERNTDVSRLRALGFRADNSNLTLRSRFGSVAQAQLFFPSAQSLDEYLDGCCVERLLQLNETYFGRAAIKLPAGGIRFSRTLDITGKDVSIEGSGKTTTQLILYVAGGTLIRRSLAQSARPFQLANLTLSCEVAPAGTRALDISYDASPALFFMTTLTDVDIYGFEQPMRVRNPGRGLHMDRVCLYGPHGTVQPTAALEIVVDDSSAAHSAQACFKSVRVANYRWGWDVNMKLGAGGTEANRRSMEGFIFYECGAFNGWGMVRCRQEYNTYHALLWEFYGCDWQGSGNALDMQRCQKIDVYGGFWITNTPMPAGDAADPMGYPERRYFSFHDCQNVRLHNLRIDCPSDFPAHVLVDVDVLCEDVRIEGCIVRDYSPNAKAGFRIAGKKHNTVKEVGTTWDVWASAEDLRVYDVFGNQVSQTRASKYGTVDETGEYHFRGRASVTLDSNGHALIQLPRRPATAEANNGNVTPFFLGNIAGEPNSPFIQVTPRSANYRVTPTVNAASVWEFIITCGPGQAGQQFDVDWSASGR